MWTSSVGSRGGDSRKGNSGVTLLELILVVTILALLAGLVTPGVGHWIDIWKLRGAAERLSQSVRYARIRAVYEQRYYLVEMRSGESRVRVLEPVSGFVREFSLPSDIEWNEDGEAASSPVLHLVLPPSGAFEEKTLWLRNRRGDRARVHLDFLAGGPEIEVVRRGT